MEGASRRRGNCGALCRTRNRAVNSIRSGFYAGFHCASVRLAVEPDSCFHDHAEQMAQDAQRDAWERSQGVRVLWIKAHDIIRDFDDVARHILHHGCAFPLHHPGKD
ncbi:MULTISPECIES: DUF559 domain-containing protein [Sphingobium]|nr:MULTISPECIES: DUF559 domain-containing protein [Sphingobium]WDA38868.1 DUF559 domain-containing protein [Sphingobium sp. YC-XJ3]